MIYSKHIFFCINQKANGKKCCANNGGEIYLHYMRNKLRMLDVHNVKKIRISNSGCLGRCNYGPCIVIYPDSIWYTYTSFDDLDEIINTHLFGGQQVDRLVI